MRTIRVFQSGSFSAHHTYTLNKEASAHLIQVLRLRAGDHFILFNGQGGEYRAELLEANKKAAQITVSEFIARECESPIELHLGQALLRQEKMDWVIQKAVELGATSVTPLLLDHCNIKLADDRVEKRQQHWEHVVISASEQCGRNRLMRVREPRSLTAWLKDLNVDHMLLFDPEGHATWERARAYQKIALLIGPEGGFSPEELQLAKAHDVQIYPLGPRILRTETAAIAAMSIVQANVGDLAATPL